MQPVSILVPHPPSTLAQSDKSAARKRATGTEDGEKSSRSLKDEKPTQAKDGHPSTFLANKEQAPKQTTQPAPRNVCGPDITSQLLDLLVRLRADYRRRGPDLKRRKCAELLSFPAGLSAWDINMLAPGMRPPEGQPDKPGWFEPYARQCAKPASQCRPTATFMGRCFHSQVLNYLQWGAMNRLCQQMEPAHRVHTNRDRFMALIWHRTGLTTSHFHQQIVISDLGAAFVDAIDAGPDPLSDTDRLQILRRAETALRAGIARYPENWDERPAAACETSCQMSREEQDRFDAVTWGYIWTPNR